MTDEDPLLGHRSSVEKRAGTGITASSDLRAFLEEAMRDPVLLPPTNA
jgi:hypothetical protein